MDKQELRRRFIIDENELKSHLDELVAKALEYCRIDNRGRIHFEKWNLSNKNKIRVALAARAIASELDPQISADVSVADLVESVGLAENQIRARCSQIVAENDAESPKRGVYRVVFGKIERILSSVKL